MTDNLSNLNTQSAPENALAQISADINANNVPNSKSLNKSKCTKGSYTETDLKNAIQQALMSNTSIGKIASQYNIPRTTLFEKVRKEVLRRKAKIQALELKRVRKMQLDFAIRAYLTRTETIEKIAGEFKISPKLLRKKVYKTDDDTESEETPESDNELDNNWVNKFLEVQMTEQPSTPYIPTPASDPQNTSPTPIMNPFAIHKPLKKRFEFTPVLRKVTEMCSAKRNSPPSQTVTNPEIPHPAVTSSPVSSPCSCTPLMAQSSPTQCTGSEPEPRPKKYMYRLKSRAAGATYCYLSTTPITLIKPIIRLDKLSEKEIAQLKRKVKEEAKKPKEAPAKRRKTGVNQCSGSNSEVAVDQRILANSTNVKVVLQRLDAAMLPGTCDEVKLDVSRLETECSSVIAEPVVAVKEEPLADTGRVPPAYSEPEPTVTKEKSLRDSVDQLNVFLNGVNKGSGNSMHTRKKRLKFLPDGTLILPRSRMKRNFSPEQIRAQSRKHRAKSKSSAAESDQSSTTEALFSKNEDVDAAETIALNKNSSNSNSHSLSIVEDNVTVSQKRNSQPEKDAVLSKESTSSIIENDLNVTTPLAKKISNHKPNVKAVAPQPKVKEVPESTLSRKHNNRVNSLTKDLEYSGSPPITPPPSGTRTIAVTKLNADKTVKGIVNPAQILSCLLRIPILPNQLNVVRFRPRFSGTNTVNRVNLTPSKLKEDNNVIKPITKRQLELLKSTPFKIVPKSQIQAVLHNPVKEEPLANGMT